MKRLIWFPSVLILGIIMMSGFLAAPAAAQEICSRVHVFFEASEATTLDGKLSVGYEQRGGGQYGFVDFWLDEEEIAAGETFRIGAFNISGIDSFRLFFKDGQIDVDGNGKFSTQVTDCTAAAPAEDGRLNRDDAASLAVIYLNTQTGGYDVYLVNSATGSGDLVIRVTRAEVDAARAAATAPGGVNTLIEASGTASLWALTSGECQRNAFYPDGKPDVFIFACTANP
ncbi:MAG: hypothetical protein K8J31_25735 [Anaerolineae bacterium]|nr:hypothetical protein [Anaerolineae bacterium]